MKVKKKYQIELSEYEKFLIITRALCIDKKEFVALKIRRFNEDNKSILQDEGYYSQSPQAGAEKEVVEPAPQKRTKWIDTIK